MLLLIHPQCTTRTYIHTHTHTHAHASACTGCPLGAFIQRPPLHILAQLLSASSLVFVFCLLLLIAVKMAFIFQKDSETQDEEVSSPSTKFASGWFEREGASTEVASSPGTKREKSPAVEGQEERRNPPLKWGRESNCLLTS